MKVSPARDGSPGIGTPIREEPLAGEIPAIARPDWTERFPWLIHGTTTRGSEEAPFDLRLNGEGRTGETLERWDRLRHALGCDAAVHARQVHGPVVRVHRAGASGLVLAPPCDGHITADSGVLLTVSIADCVPVFMVAPERGVLALVHAGWRGVAAGILERSIETLRERFGADPDQLELHLGPAISGEAYEVGPEVHRALGLPEPPGPAFLDLRRHLAERAEGLGVPSEQIGVSTRCTRGDEALFSHRGGSEGRQVAFLGRRPGMCPVVESRPIRE